MFDHINANIIVSGAFAMFDTDLVKRVGGYQVNTIGEGHGTDHASPCVCASQGKEYHIACAPEAKCMTQLPFTYKDYYHQRRRWHIGLLQSMKFHKYMLGNKNYGWAGITSGTFFILYELSCTVFGDHWVGYFNRSQFTGYFESSIHHTGNYPIYVDCYMDTGNSRKCC